jgi:hypothetical protein
MTNEKRQMTNGKFTNVKADDFPFSIFHCSFFIYFGRQMTNEKRQMTNEKFTNVKADDFPFSIFHCSFHLFRQANDKWKLPN